QTNKNLNDAELIKTVSEIINNVRLRGDDALLEYTKKFDSVELEKIEVSQSEIDDANSSVSSEFKQMFQRVIANIENYQKLILPKSWLTIDETGSKLGELITPLDKVGLYIPAGTAPLISTIAMSAAPAYIAGVKNIYMCVPPAKNGKVNPYILAAAKMAKVSKIFKVGGAQAIAAFAIGTATIPKVDKIIGPGNIYVTIAKKLVYGEVNIDMIAGPSEILILADDTAQPEFVIADLLSQAEHDILASAYLVTANAALAEYVKNNIYKKAQSLSRFKIMEKSLADNFKIFLVDNLEFAIDIVNEIAPEHLEICVSSSEAVLKKIKNAGAIFIGNWTPEAVGDYYAGPSHILPTCGTAKFYSPVSSETFIKRTSIIEYSKQKFLQAADDIIMLAKLEELTAHSLSAEIRKN
ncbi:MAG TPA: histidinol dehydrogenase, partial [bacterium]|nr:histidinol dehydrogenase [bacterium]